MSTQRIRMLFLCTGNSCRSQMAEGWARTLCGDFVEASSAGIEAVGLNPRAVAAMREAGVDISAQTSKTISQLPADPFDLVITVCGHADANCPVLPAETRVVHVPFDDPPKLAADAAEEEQIMQPYRRVRDEIRQFIERLPVLLPQWGFPAD
jgi:arsenate reductase (thioredoxin)